MAELTAMLPAPPRFRFVLVPVIPPESVRVPESELMRLLPARVIAPESVLEPETLSMAPLLLTPLPDRLMALVMLAPMLEVSRVAPLAIVTAPVPSALLFWTWR